MREHIRQILVSVTALLLASKTSASKPSVVWRSLASGVLAAPAPTNTPPVATLAVTCGSNHVYWSPHEFVLGMPDVAGGYGQYVYALATATALPAGLSFGSATGAMTVVARINVVK